MSASSNSGKSETTAAGVFTVANYLSATEPGMGNPGTQGGLRRAEAEGAAAHAAVAVAERRRRLVGPVEEESGRRRRQSAAREREVVQAQRRAAVGVDRSAHAGRVRRPDAVDAEPARARV